MGINGVMAGRLHAHYHLGIPILGTQAPIFPIWESPNGKEEGCWKFGIIHTLSEGLGTFDQGLIDIEFGSRKRLIGK